MESIPINLFRKDLYQIYLISPFPRYKHFHILFRNFFIGFFYYVINFRVKRGSSACSVLFTTELTTLGHRVWVRLWEILFIITGRSYNWAGGKVILGGPLSSEVLILSFNFVVQRPFRALSPLRDGLRKTSLCIYELIY